MIFLKKQESNQRLKKEQSFNVSFRYEYLDMLLAAQAISKNFIFVTNNVKEFKRVPNLIMENWAE